MDVGRSVNAVGVVQNAGVVETDVDVLFEAGEGEGCAVLVHKQQ